MLVHIEIYSFSKDFTRSNKFGIGKGLLAIWDSKECRKKLVSRVNPNKYWCIMGSCKHSNNNGSNGPYNSPGAEEN